jgi:hypothetical protein
MAAPMATKKAAPKSAAKKAAPKTTAGSKKAAPKKAAAPAPAAPSPADAAAHAKSVEKQMEKAEHQHQDPRGPAHSHNPAAQAHNADPRKDTGSMKTRGAPRMNKIVNWFRRGKGR